MTLSAFPPEARRSVALRVLGMLSSDDLPEIALCLLELPGSPSAAALAGEGPRERAELFDAALAELGLELPSRLEAARYLRLQVAREAARGDVRPRAAAELIRDIYQEVELDLPRGERVGSSLNVGEVIGLYYSFDGVESASEFAQLEGELLEALKTIAGEEG
ncbi:MAG: hypothetical protein HOW73_49010 [Polyangiaceae bacterium]|nr:hypothetical protein [Polyangiaceae bacterium]